jgi:hypothetical protein
MPGLLKLVVMDPLAPPPAFEKISHSGNALTMSGAGGVRTQPFAFDHHKPFAAGDELDAGS